MNALFSFHLRASFLPFTRGFCSLSPGSSLKIVVTPEWPVDTMSETFADAGIPLGRIRGCHADATQVIQANLVQVDRPFEHHSRHLKQPPESVTYLLTIIQRHLMLNLCYVAVAVAVEEASANGCGWRRHRDDGPDGSKETTPRRLSALESRAARE